MKKPSIVVPPKACGDCRDCSNHCGKSAPVPLDAALDRLFHAVRLEPVAEDVPVEQAADRITARRHCAAVTTPNCNVAMKDGVAVNWAGIGEKTDAPFRPFMTDRYKIVPMGAPVPGVFDTLLHAEQCRNTAEGMLIFERPVPGQCISYEGSSLEEGEQILPADVRLRADHLMMLRMGGVESVSVLKKPRVAIIPTGRDLVPGGIVPPYGKKIESVGIYVKALAEGYEASADLFAPAGDDALELSSVLVYAAKRYDVIAVIGGVGKGKSVYNDHTVSAVEKVGTVVQHGVLVHPGGSPSLLAQIGGTPVLGIPGPPHAALIMADLLVGGETTVELLTCDIWGTESDAAL
ncbi:MAG: molybdopterin-binding protein [Bacillota bacterium]